jgi:hypothetical protein
MQVGRICKALVVEVAYLASLYAVKQAKRLAPGLHLNRPFPRTVPFLELSGPSVRSYRRVPGG